MAPSLFVSSPVAPVLLPVDRWLAMPLPPGASLHEVPDLEVLCQHLSFLRSIPGAELISAVEPFLGHTHLLKHPSSPGCCHSNSSKGRQTNHQPPDFKCRGPGMFFRIELLLQSQRPEVEEMIRDMGVGQSAVEQLAVYCVSLKKYVSPAVPLLSSL